MPQDNPNKENIENLVIIGSGPAGLTAGLYSSRADLKPIIIDGNKPGGQLMGTSYVENWPGNQSILGPTLIMNMRDHAKHFGCRFLAKTVKNINTSKKPFTITTNDDQTIKAHAVIIATGASPRRLGCPGEDEYWGKGITTCAVCDGAFYKDKKVIVIGGGDSAMEDASFLHKFTKDITVIHIKDTLSASTAMQKRVLNNPDIKVLYNSTVTGFTGDGQKVQAAEITSQETGEKQTLEIDGAFVAIGLIPNTGFLKGKIDLSAHGYVVIKGGKTHSQTSAEGIFAAGDVSDPFYKQAITSSGTGCMAAIDAERYLVQILE